MFSTQSDNCTPFVHIFDIIFLFTAELEETKNWHMKSRDNALANKNFLDWSKLKAFADNKINAIEKLKFVFGRAKNIVEIGENAGYHFPTMFSCMFQGYLYKVIKSQDCVVNS